MRNSNFSAYSFVCIPDYDNKEGEGNNSTLKFFKEKVNRRYSLSFLRDVQYREQHFPLDTWRKGVDLDASNLCQVT